jgi:glycine/D-amino acid oxidase-like deaminating enzyme
MGSTAASTSILQYEIDTSLVELAGLIGGEDAALAYRLCHEGVLEIGRIVAGLPDRCGFAACRSLQAASTADDAAGLEAEARARREIGIAVRALGGEELAAMAPPRAAGALLSETAAVVDAYRLTRALLGEAGGRGARVYGRTRAVSIERVGEGRLEVRTDVGPVVRAGAVVVAAGYEAHDMLAEPVADLRSTFALATEPVGEFPGWPRGEPGGACFVMWETARPYFYLRTTEDGRAIIGGLDEPHDDPASRDAMVRPKAELLLARLREMFPQVGGVRSAHAWAGTFGQTADGLAYLGEAPGMPGVIFALGYGGNGMTFSAVMAPMVAAMLRGLEAPGAHLFRFGRGVAAPRNGAAGTR